MRPAAGPTGLGARATFQILLKPLECTPALLPLSFRSTGRKGIGRPLSHPPHVSNISPWLFGRMIGAQATVTVAPSCQPKSGVCKRPGAREEQLP